MRTLVCLVFALALAACGEPSPAERLAALGVSVNGNVLGTQVPIAAASAPTGIAGPFASDSAAAIALAGDVDVPRTVQVAFDSGWDRSVIVIVCGQDSVGSICDYLYPLSAKVGGTVPFWRVDSVRLSAVGRSSGTATVGPGSALGLAALRQKVDPLSYDVARQYLPGDTGASSIEPAAVLQGAGDPAVVPMTQPDGQHYYEIYASLR